MDLDLDEFLVWVSALKDAAVSSDVAATVTAQMFVAKAQADGASAALKANDASSTTKDV